MKKKWLVKFSLLVCGIFILFNTGNGQINSATVKSSEISDNDGIPVLVKHLPDWENARKRATYILDQKDLRNALGNRPILDLIDFESGTEAVTAPYNQGKLLLVEFTSPQASVDADAKIQQLLAENTQNPPIFYRRIGNYNVLFFDSDDEEAANALFDQIKFQKKVQWLGEDPFYIQRLEHAKIDGWSQVFVAIIISIVGGIGFAVIIGIIAGLLFFRWRVRSRLKMKEFTDAGGMIRLNLDGFTPAPDRLLGD